MKTSGIEGTTRQQALKRLSYIEGHLAGIRRMVERDKPCVEIMRQTNALRRAIQKVEVLLLRAYLGAWIAPHGGGGVPRLDDLRAIFGHRQGRSAGQ